MRLPIEDPDLWANIHKRFQDSTRESPDGCLIWVKGRIGPGYGAISVQGHQFRAHRIAYQLANGPLPDDSLQVLHKCDVRACVNPDHLYLGTHQDNMHDRKVRGTKPHDRWRPRAERYDDRPKKEIDVDGIRHAYHSGNLGLMAICFRFNLSLPTLYKVIKINGWKMRGSGRRTDLRWRMGKKH